jgi:MinD-like ATPase involved in chromosome partitioning or flagellar assembly
MRAAEPNQTMFADDRTDSTPHPDFGGNQVAANPATSGSHLPVNPAVSGGYPVQGVYQQAQYAEVMPSGPQQQPQYRPRYDQNLPPLYPDPSQYWQPGQVPLPQPQQGRHAQTGADDLSTAHLVKQIKRRPQSGWRKAVYVASGKLVNPGESPADTRRRELIARVNQPLRGCFKIAMLSLKGGVGKTTTTTTLGSTFASLRGDRVVAVDANPDRGTLSQKIPIETTATVRHLLRDADTITRYSDVRSYTSQGSSRLEILASEQDPAVSEAFSEGDYRRAVNLLEHFYNIVLTDCGTGLMHSAMKGVLDVADSLVLVSSGSVDGARSASGTLDWLEAHGYGELVKRSVAVINSVRPKSGSVDLDKLSAHFGARVRAVCRIPFDPHLEEGAEIELDRLSGDTRLSLLELAATVADGFAR